jgi:hypothetical protein
MSSQSVPPPLRPTRLPQWGALSGAATARGYDAEVAYCLAVIAAWTYSELSTFQLKLRQYDLPAGWVIEEISAKNGPLLIFSSAFVLRNDENNTMIVSYWGTEPLNILNWATDFNVELVKFDRRARAAGALQPLVSRGFYDNTQATAGEIASRIVDFIKGYKATKNRGPRPRIYITGHSLGAAMATLFGAALYTMEDEAGGFLSTYMHGVYAFASPAVGDASFRTWAESSHHDDLPYSKLVTRFRFARDPVPTIPAQSMLYVHIGQEFHGGRWPRKGYPLATAFAPCANTQAANAFSYIWILVGIVFSYLFRRVMEWPCRCLASIEDHGPNNYVNCAAL